MPRSLLCLARLACLLALGAPLVARSLESQELPVFGTGVTVVTVPVFVTDKSGKAVAGLIAADFEVEDQGKKVPLVAFQAVDAAIRRPPPRQEPWSRRLPGGSSCSSST